MLLSEKERELFANYLDCEAKSNDRMAKKMEELPGAFPVGVVELLLKDAAVFAYVAAKIRMVEVQTTNKEGQVCEDE